jgi:Bifunctional DNA primase/polymerase, N-terminal
MAGKIENTFLEQALDYHRLGWCVIPIPQRQKAARIKWSKYQQIRPDEAHVKKWFSNGSRNIAVILGEVSGGLTCRDFDTMTEYEKWSAGFPDLARTLPTVQTARGMHVYFEGHVKGIRHIANGELRGSNGYCLLPPSIHPDGPIYQWKIPVKNGDLLILDPKLAGFMPDVTEKTEHTEKTEKTEQTEAIIGGNEVEKAIIETLPQEYGTRNRKIFELAHYLKSLPQYNEANPKDLREIVEQWYKLALPNIRTKEFEETWIDFLKGWGRIKYPKGEEPMAQIFQSAIEMELPAIVIQKYPDNKNLQLLACLCNELQRAAGDNPFYLSARTAGRLLKVSPMSANRWLFLLVEDGIIKVIRKGGTAQTTRKATRYKYIPN